MNPNGGPAAEVDTDADPPPNVTDHRHAHSHATLIIAPIVAEYFLHSGAAAAPGAEIAASRSAVAVFNGWAVAPGDALGLALVVSDVVPAALAVVADWPTAAFAFAGIERGIAEYFGCDTREAPYPPE